jgi:hypothetical protein
MDVALWKEVQLLEQKRVETSKKLRDLAAKERITNGSNKRKREKSDEKLDEPETKRARTESAPTKEDSTSEARRELPKAPVDIQMRNKKMFSILMGTLKGAKDSLSQQEKSDVIQRRKQLEQKVETKVQEDQEQLKETYLKQIEEQKKEVLSQKESVESELKEKEVALLQSTLKAYHQLTSGYIATKAAPQIYYLPAKRDEKINKLIDESKKQLEDKHSAALQLIEPRTLGSGLEPTINEDKNDETSQQEKEENSNRNDDNEVAGQ